MTLVSRFRALPDPSLSAIEGTHEAVFVGPAVLRAAAPRAIALGGMPRWYGKRFAASGAPDVLEGVNLLRAPGGGFDERLSMRAAVAPSWLDGRPALVVSYVDAPPPWRWVRDEFRSLDETTLLGLTFVASPRLRALAQPFTLERREIGSSFGS